MIAGDVFHTVRPSNPAILHAFRQFTRLRAALPDALVVMVAGNHDAPRTTETGCILRLFRELGIHVVDDGAAAPLLSRARPARILAVPDVPGTRPALRPTRRARYNVLLLHGEVEGMLPEHAMPQRPRGDRDHARGARRRAAGSYVALGHYHVYREIAPNAYYSGSIDYTSANAWGELVRGARARLAGQGDHRARPRHRRAHVPPVPPAAAARRPRPVSARAG